MPKNQRRALGLLEGLIRLSGIFLSVVQLFMDYGFERHGCTIMRVMNGSGTLSYALWFAINETLKKRRKNSHPRTKGILRRNYILKP